MTETCTIILELPNPALSPNGQHGHWMKRAMITKRYRRLACEATQAEQIETGPWEKVVVTATFYHKDNRRRDGVNFNAMLKAAQDGIVDSGLVYDDDATCWSTMPPIFKIDTKFPRVEITIERIM